MQALSFILLICVMAALKRLLAFFMSRKRDNLDSDQNPDSEGTAMFCSLDALKAEPDLAARDAAAYPTSLYSRGGLEGSCQDQWS